MNIRILLCSLLVAVLFFGSAQEYGEVIDPRDGKTYKVITVDIPLEGDVMIRRTWMAENMNYEVVLERNDGGSFCYKNESEYCEAYGRLYTFKAAQKACPEGWHLPTGEDWRLLFGNYGGRQNAGIALQKGGKSGIDLLLGGFGDPGRVFKNIGISGNYWDAGVRSSNTAGLISVQGRSEKIFHSIIGSWHRNSCRCIKDY